MSKFLAIALAAPVLACPLVAPPALAQASQDTLADAIASALSNNPNLLAQRKANEAAGERLAQARAGGLPSVTLSGSYATQHTTQGLQFDVMGRRFPLSGDSQQAKAGLDARQSLYAGGAVTARTRQARAGVESADAQLAAYENEVILQVISAYLDVRRARSEVETASPTSRLSKLRCRRPPIGSTSATSPAPMSRRPRRASPAPRRSSRRPAPILRRRARQLREQIGRPPVPAGRAAVAAGPAGYAG
ncbi:MAG: TolC family protein [Hyphomonadaceae bacterium]